jgi:hypothetical protein
MALKRAVFVRPKNVGELWPQMAGLAGSGWDLAGATEIFPVVAGWLRRAATEGAGRASLRGPGDAGWSRAGRRWR